MVFLGRQQLSALTVVLTTFLMLAENSLPAETIPSVNGFIGQPFPISSNYTRASDPIGAASNGTNFLVVWNDEQSSIGIVASLISSNGTVVRQHSLANSGVITWPQVASDGKDYLIVWLKNHDTIMAAEVSAADAPTTPFVLYTNSNISLPALSHDTTNWLITFSQQTTNDGVFGLFLGTNQTVTAPFRISDPSADQDSGVSVAFNGENYLVAWKRGNAGDKGLYAARVTPSGVVLDTNNITVDATTAYHDSVSVATDGNDFLVQWRDSFYRSRAARVSSAGQLLDTNSISVSLDDTMTYTDMCYAGNEYVVVLPVTIFDPLDILAEGRFLSSSGEIVAQFSITNCNTPQAVASDGRGRILVVTGGTARFLGIRPNVTTIDVVGNQTTIVWGSVKGRTYQLEQNSNLQPTGWTQATLPITASGSSCSASIPINSGPVFYRVRQFP